MDIQEFNRATRKGAAVGGILFVVLGIPLTLLYGSYGGYRFFARLGMDGHTDLWGKAGYVVGGFVGFFSFLFLFIALGASVAGGICFLKWLFAELREKDE